MDYELVIAGAGPAGLAAAVYAARAEIKAVVVEQAPMAGGQIINTEQVDNYPGLPGLSGFELASRFREHCDKMGVTFLEGEITGAQAADGKIHVQLGSGETLESNALIIATGARSRKLGIPGEEEFTGHGVSYCATCDGAFFRGKKTVVMGGGDVAVEDAIFLSRFASKVSVCLRRHEFRAAKSLVTKLLSLPNVEVCYETVLTAVVGGAGGHVEKVLTKSTADGSVGEIPVDGVFIAVGTSPNSEAFRGFVSMDAGGYVIAGEDTKTDIPGVFAAGDVRTKMLRQIVTAAADGANAITAVERWLNEN